MRNVRLHIILFFTFLCIGHSNLKIYAQTISNLSLEYQIKSKVIKNIVLSDLYFRQSFIKDSTLLNSDIEITTQGTFYYLQYPGFGYLPSDLDVEIAPVELKFPDENWTLYNIIFLRTPQNDTLVSWNNYKYSKAYNDYIIGSGSLFNLVTRGKLLIAVSKNREIKFISGFDINHPIAQYFKLKNKKPKSYLSFLQLKLFNQQPDKIEFLREENDLLVFATTKFYGKLVSQKEYYIDPKKPDHFVKSRFTTPPISYSQVPKDLIPNNENFKLDLHFTSLEDKKRYILDALMKNIYMHRLLHLDNPVARLNIDTATWQFKEGPSDFDKMLPNYDEYLAQFKLLEYVCCFTNSGPWECPGLNDKERIEYPIFEPIQLDNKYRLVVGSTRMYGNVEFYKFYKAKDEVLIRRPNKNNTEVKNVNGLWCGVSDGFFGEGEGTQYRYDLYYRPEKQKDKVEGLPEPCAYPPPNELNSIHKIYDNVCPPYKPLPAYGRIIEPVDHYLVALDTKTREVYFLSGKDIYLSKATTLYRPGESPQEPADINKWELPEKLVYIRDRLYRYRVDKVKEDNIITKDDDKMILEVKGEEYNKPITLRVIFYNATPEMLSIEKIND